MSQEADEAFAKILPTIAVHEEAYENVCRTDPIARGLIGRQILELVDGKSLSTEYLRHCEQQVESELPEARRARIELMICIITSRNATH